METRVAIISIIIENPENVEKLNKLLHEYMAYTIGRMGIPYKQKDIYIISIAIDAPQDTEKPQNQRPCDFPHIVDWLKYPASITETAYS